MSTENKSQSILIVDDNISILSFLSASLRDHGYDIITAANGSLAVEAARDNMPDLILLDINMPEMDGYEACKIIKSDKHTKEIPIIFISTQGEKFNKLKAFEVGAIDYITKPILIEETLARVSVHLNLSSKIAELEEFNKIMVDREMRIIELKNEINEFALKLGEKSPYPEVWND